MRIKNHIRGESESRQDLSAALEGRVFHCTKLANLLSIRADGEIRPNADGKLVTSFGSSGRSYFRLRNCVSVFDYRIALTPEVIYGRRQCNPFHPAEPDGDGVAILFVKRELHAALLPWTACREEVGQKEVVVPYAEAGHPGPIPISMIEEVICLSLRADMATVASALAACLRSARLRREGSG
jgi:hypothetical protein